jgi:anthranilate phosphoribosyltransferase
MAEFADLLTKIVARQNLTTDEARAAFDLLRSGQLEAPQVAGLLAALATKGEAVDEIVGAAQAMRAAVDAVSLPADAANAIDTCGTGGDGKPVFNVSTTVAIVAAAAGATVAKHGNRSVTRPSGSAEALGALGVNTEADVHTVEQCLAHARVAFLYAVKLHPAMKHAAPVRRSLGVRTIFNLVGPLTNPAGVKRQLLGVNKAELLEKMGDALRKLGAERAMVVHGLEGLCDLSIAGPSRVARWDGHALLVEEVTPDVVGAPTAPLEKLFVDSANASAKLIHGILAGDPGPARETVVLNAAAALWVAGLADDWASGAAQARAALDSGAARKTLEQWIATSHAQTSLRPE